MPLPPLITSSSEPPSPSPGDLIPELVHDSCTCTPLFCPTPVLSNYTFSDSSPDSPSMPWRPGPSAYPPAISEDRHRSRLQHISKLELQKLYDSLAESSYDLSLRDIVEPPFTIHGAPSASSSDPEQKQEAQPESSLPHNRSRRVKAKPYLKHYHLHHNHTHHHHQQHDHLHCLRSHSCRSSDSNYGSPSSPNSKLAFSFSFPRRRTVLLGPALSSPPKQTKKKLTPSPPSKKTNQKFTSSSAPGRECAVDIKPHPASSQDHSAQSTKHGQTSPLLSHSVIPASPKKPSFKRTSSAHHRSPLPSPSQAEKKSDPQTSARAPFYVRGPSRSRVHPSSQCSACASYTIFFKSRCMVCGKLYCSNCAKDAMDNGRRCRSTCGSSRVGSKRFSKGVQSRCWPLCGNVEVSKSPSKCKVNSKE